MGNRIFTLTGRPPWRPGFQSGAFSNTRMASSLQPPPTPRKISTSWIDPSLLTTKTKNTVPSIPILTACLGYVKLPLRYCAHPSIPPGGVGICSAKSLTSSAVSAKGGPVGRAGLLTTGSSGIAISRIGSNFSWISLSFGTYLISGCSIFGGLGT